jgi:hypothetical protein
VWNVSAERCYPCEGICQYALPSAIFLAGDLAVVAQDNGRVATGSFTLRAAPHKFNIGDGTARGTYTITGLMPGLEEPTAEYNVAFENELTSE